MGALLQELNAQTQLECTPQFPTDFGNVQTTIAQTLSMSPLNTIQITSNGTIISPSITTLSSVTNTSADGTTLTLTRQLTKLISGPDGSCVVTCTRLTPEANVLSVICNESDYVWSYNDSSSVFSVNVTLHSTALVNVTYYESYYVLKGQFHTHTTKSDGSYTPTQVVDRYKQAGFDVIAITDHGTTAGVAEAQLEGDKVSLLVVSGEEVSIQKYPTDVAVLALFIPSKVTESDCWGKPTQYCFDIIHSMGGIGIVAHPFANMTHWQPLLANHASYIDGWEIATIHGKLSDNDIATVIADGYLYTGDHDYHSGSVPATRYTVLFCVNKTVSGIREALTSRRDVVIYGSSIYGTSQAIELFNLYNASARATTKLSDPSISVNYGDSVAILTRLTDTTGNPVPNKTIKFYIASNYIGSANSDSMGWASLSYTANLTPSNYELKVVFDGDSSYGSSSKTGTLTVNEVTKVSSSISISLSLSSLPLGSSTTISGTISPAHIASVAIYYRVSGATTWNALASVTSGSSGSYAYAWTPSSSGTYEIKASWSGDSDHNGAESSVQTLTVKASSTTNLLKNPGFESGSTYWSQNRYGTITASFTITSGAHSGTKAGKVSVSAFTAGSEVGWAQIVKGLPIGATYKVRCWYKSNVPVALVVYFCDANWGYVSHKSISLSASTTWKQTSYLTFSIPQKTAMIKVLVNLKTVGYVIIDDFELYRV